MKFTKMHGCGNDYVYVNCFEEHVENPNELARIVSDRHYGIGGDGMILIVPTDRADAYMRMFNADGTEDAMCGNGIRCVAKYIYDHGIIPTDRRTCTVDTVDGIKTIDIKVEDGKAVELTVDMGAPKLISELPEAITVQGMDLSFVGVDPGSIHAVYFLDENPALGVSAVAELPLEQYGEDFENHPRFPNRTNSEFIEVISPREVRSRVWERGSDETWACGTGATATVFAGNLLGKLENEVLVHMRGGDVRVRYVPETGHCFLIGPATEVFTGDFPTGGIF